MVHRYLGFVFMSLISCAAPNTRVADARASGWATISRELDRVRNEAAKCRQPGQPDGRGHLRFVFLSNVEEPSVSFEYGKYRDTPIGECVLNLAKTVRVPPFEGRPASVGLDVVLGEDDGPPQGMFDRSSAAVALGNADVRKCHDGRSVFGHAKVTFATDGSVLRVEADQPPAIVGTPFAACIESAFRAIHVRPFSGAPVTVGKSFSVGRQD